MRRRVLLAPASLLFAVAAVAQPAPQAPAPTASAPAAEVSPLLGLVLNHLFNQGVEAATGHTAGGLFDRLWQRMRQGGAAPDEAADAGPVEPAVGYVIQQLEPGSFALACQRQPGLRLDRQALRIGALAMTITPDRDGCLYIALAGSDGQSLYLLYPNALDGRNAVRAGRTVTLPGASWEIVAKGPPGRDRLLVMVADRPRDLTLLRGRSADPFLQTLLDGDGRSRLQWLLAKGQAGGCAVGSACSDAFASALAELDEVR